MLFRSPRCQRKSKIGRSFPDSPIHSSPTSTSVSVSAHSRTWNSSSAPTSCAPCRAFQGQKNACSKLSENDYAPNPHYCVPSQVSPAYARGAASQAHQQCPVFLIRPAGDAPTAVAPSSGVVRVARLRRWSHASLIPAQTMYRPLSSSDLTRNG